MQWSRLTATAVVSGFIVSKNFQYASQNSAGAGSAKAHNAWALVLPGLDVLPEGLNLQN